MICARTSFGHWASNRQLDCLPLPHSHRLPVVTGLASVAANSESGDQMDSGQRGSHGEVHLSRRDTWALWQALRAESARSADLRDRLEMLHQSKSWRITAPLRRVMAWINRQARNRTGLHPLQEVDSPATAPADWSREKIAMAVPWLPGALPSARSRRLFVDVTELAIQDLGGGIQRMVGKILAELMFSPPSTHAVTPVRLAADGRYVHASRYQAKSLGMPEGALGLDLPVQVMAGDVFVGLDLLRDRGVLAGEAMNRLRSEGAGIVVVVYDLLPLQHPEWFPEGVPARYREWFDVVAMKADRLICISEVVRRECEEMIAAQPPPLRPLICHIPLGGDLPDYLWCPSILPKTVPSARRFLMVGTIEPRKGHAEAITAFERLWATGQDVHLVIAGRPGWNVDSLVALIENHPEVGRRLHFIEGPDDQTLAALYRECDHLLMASHGEGFGLPVVEALFAGCRPVLRDLPVLREAARGHGIYFSGDQPEALVAAILASLGDSEREGRLGRIGLATWADSASALVKACGVGDSNSRDPLQGRK